MNKSQQQEIMVMRAKMNADKARDEHEEAWYSQPAEEAAPITPPEDENANTPTGI